jgi:hypothetical protein
VSKVIGGLMVAGAEMIWFSPFERRERCEHGLRLIAPPREHDCPDRQWRIRDPRRRRRPITDILVMAAMNRPQGQRGQQ